MNSLVKNATTKSVILAPFNSTLEDWTDEHIKELLVSKKDQVLKFGPKAREADRMYE